MCYQREIGLMTLPFSYGKDDLITINSITKILIDQLTMHLYNNYGTIGYIKISYN